MIGEREVKGSEMGSLGYAVGKERMPCWAAALADDARGTCFFSGDRFVHLIFLERCVKERDRMR